MATLEKEGPADVVFSITQAVACFIIRSNVQRK